MAMNHRAGRPRTRDRMAESRFATLRVTQGKGTPWP